MKKYKLVYMNGMMTKTDIFWDYPNQITQSIMDRCSHHMESFISLIVIIESEPFDITEEPHPNA